MTLVQVATNSTTPKLFRRVPMMWQLRTSSMPPSSWRRRRRCTATPRGRWKLFSHQSSKLYWHQSSHFSPHKSWRRWVLPRDASFSWRTRLIWERTGLQLRSSSNYYHIYRCVHLTMWAIKEQFWLTSASGFEIAQKYLFLNINFLSRLMRACLNNSSPKIFLGREGGGNEGRGN